MADTEFEEFRQCFDKLPQHIKAPAPFYSLVPAVLDDDDSPTSSKSDGDCDDMDTQAPGSSGPSSLGLIANGGNAQQVCASSGAADDAYCSLEERPRSSASMHSPLPPGLQSLHHHGGGHMQQQHHHHHHHHHHHQYPQVVEVQRQHVSGPMPPPPHCWIPTGERRRRRLPEIPKSKRVPSFASTSSSEGGPSLASELASLHSVNASGIPGHICSTLSLRREIDSSPDSERPYTDVDSGHSTAHSPVDGAKSLSPPFGSHTEMLEATHRGLHKFVPRHRDEIEVEIGDPIYVQKEADDLWCEGVNLRTGRAGIFPSAYAVDTDYSEFDPACEQVRRERYLLGYLGSVETLAHKGTAVVCQATRRVAGAQSHACVLEVSDRGLRMVDRTKPMPDQPCIDYFYSLKNVSFCAFHPRDHRYLGFITKHPTLQRFACHVFRGNESTRPVAEAVGRAFQRFYQKFIETAYPIEDIYIE